MALIHGASRRGAPGYWEFQTYCRILSRTSDVNSADYPRYGGRGIDVCETWRCSFLTFLSDMGPRPSQSHSIERKNNDLGYSKANCVWATAKQQARNRANGVFVMVGAERMTIAEAVERFSKVKEATVRYRIRAGWDVTEALSKPSPHDRKEGTK